MTIWLIIYLEFCESEDLLKLWMESIGVSSILIFLIVKFDTAIGRNDEWWLKE